MLSTESCTLGVRAATDARYMKRNSPAHGSVQLDRGTDAILVYSLQVQGTRRHYSVACAQPYGILRGLANGRETCLQRTCRHTSSVIRSFLSHRFHILALFEDFRQKCVARFSLLAAVFDRYTALSEAFWVFGMVRLSVPRWMTSVLLVAAVYAVAVEAEGAIANIALLFRF